MNRLWNLFACLTKRSPARRSSARLGLESLEGRAVPSAVPINLAPAPPVVSPEMVCGYKHRGPCRPHELGVLPAQGQAVAMLDALHSTQAEVVRLIAGGSDGPLVAVDAQGHPVVLPPLTGPLAQPARLKVR